jgi:hypothetical protein
MGKFLGEDVARYEVLYEKGKKNMENDLYDGEYFIQKIKWEGLSAPNPAMASPFQVAQNSNITNEALKLVQKEGPKYQYGKGCLSDNVLGIWIGEVSGLKDIIDSVKLASHLASVHKYNFKEDLRDHANPQRPTYALGNEVWTRIEYQVASHLMLTGQVEKGLKIVRACRDRYDGRVRNPFDEYECGHWYARAMSSYALLQGLTGAFYDAVDQVMYIDSHIGDFTSFISTNTGFGNVGLKNGHPFFNIAYGDLNIKKFIV